MQSSGILRVAANRGPRECAHWPIESCWLEVSGLEIHAHVGGKGTPVVLVHGYGVSGSYMLPLAQSLVPSFSVFAPDLPGYGRSQRPRISQGIGDLAVALAAWLDAAGLECPAFVANSMGCQIVTELAVRLPGRVGPMVLAGRIEQRLPLIAQPTVVVRGENDGLVGQVWAETVAALLPRSRLVVVPSEPHAVHYTRPDLVAKILHTLVVEE